MNLMGRDNHGALLCHVLGNDLTELRLRGDVQSVGGFIHQQILGVGGHSESDIGLLALTHRKLTQTYVGRQFEISQTALQDFVREIGVEGLIEFHILRKTDGGHLKLLRYEEDVAQGFRLAVLGCDAIATYRTARGAEQT